MKRWIILALLLLFIILLWYLFSGRLAAKQPPVLLKTAAGGVKTMEFELHDSILFEAVNLSPRTGYKIQIVREDGKIITESMLSTNRDGRIPETVIWYDIGIRPCKKGLVQTATAAPLSGHEINDFESVEKNYAIKIVKDDKVVRETAFRVTREMNRPKLYAADARGCPKSGFLIGEEDVWVVGRNFPKGSIIRLWAVPDNTEWKEADKLKDMTKQYDGGLPPIFELKADETDFKKLLWPKGLTSIGSYDIVAEVVTYTFGFYHAASTAKVQNVVANYSYSGFVIQRRQGVGEPLEQDVAGVRMSKLAFRNAFLTSENVFVGVDPYVHPTYIGKTAKVYIIADKTDAQWTFDHSLNDVTNYVETVTIQPGGCANCYSTLAWSAPLTVGKYDVVLDFDMDGAYTPGVDLIDSLDLVGFTVSEVRVDSVSFNYSGSTAVTIRDNVNGSDITPPEYSIANNAVKAAAWVMGGPNSVKVSFKADSTVNSAQIWAENGLGGLNSSGSPITVSFAGGSGQSTFSANSVPAYVGKHLFDWDWKYKNVNGASTATQSMGPTGKHLLYTVLATPQAPQAVPWLSALDIACDLANGRNNAADAMRDIWNDFYNNAGGLYDTVGGASQYTGSTTADFNLTSWLTNYNAGNIGTVNCYDMGKAVVVFANALGCGATYTYVGPFGYLNCVKPIGRGWTNNPFYDSGWYDHNPIVDGDWNSSNGRSRFGNHGFSRLGDQIYDGSGGQVDVDGDPDFGPPQTPRNLDGNDSWANNYRNRVIDDVPASSPGTPTNYNFIVD